MRNLFQEFQRARALKAYRRRQQDPWFESDAEWFAVCEELKHIKRSQKAPR